MKHLRTLAFLAGIFAALMFATASGCDPQAGDQCDKPGSYTTRVVDGKRTNLACAPAGVDQDGHQIYRWTKA